MTHRVSPFRAFAIAIAGAILSTTASARAEPPLDTGPDTIGLDTTLVDTGPLDTGIDLDTGVRSDTGAADSATAADTAPGTDTASSDTTSTIDTTAATDGSKSDSSTSDTVAHDGADASLSDDAGSNGGDDSSGACSCRLSPASTDVGAMFAAFACALIAWGRRPRRRP